ncbi:MAG: hypothetical protein ABI220_05580 [Candidatus Saccharimonadales bacterium]
MSAKGILAFGGGLLLLAAVVTVINSTSSATEVSITASQPSGSESPSATPTSTPPPPPPTSDPATGDICATEVHYFAVDAPVGSNNFGPTQPSLNVKAATKRLNVKLCSDPLFTATLVAFEKDGLNLDAAEVQSTAMSYVADKATWKNAVDEFQGDIDTMKVINDLHTYQTLGMVPNGELMPTLVRSDQKVVAGEVLVVTFKDGTVRKFRIVCDLQPIEDHFPHVPPPSVVVVTPPPSVVTVTPPPARTTIVPPPQTTTVTPPPARTTIVPPPQTTTATPPPQTTTIVTPSGKTASKAPKPTGGPVVICSYGQHLSRNGECVLNTTSSLAGPTSSSPQGKGDSGPGAVNTTAAPSAPSTISAPSSTAIVTGTVAQR